MNVPEIKYYIIIKNGEEATDISERLMNDPGVVDSCDYRENMTYTNEAVLKLLNHDGYFCNENKTGMFDLVWELEAEIYAVLNEPGAAVKKIFGGYIWQNNINNNHIGKYIEVTVPSYIGRCDRIDGANLTTQYIDETGLYCYDTGLWVIRSNVTGYPLSEGIHVITTTADEGEPIGWVQLDNGPRKSISNSAVTTVENEYGEKIEIATSSIYFKEGSTKIFIKDSTEQYPYVYYMWTSAVDLVNEIYELAGCEDTEIDEFSIPSVDGRKLQSAIPLLDGTFLNGFPVCIETDGDQKIFISVDTFLTAYLNSKWQLWYFNYALNEHRKIYETELPYGDYTYTGRLEMNHAKTRLYAFMSAPDIGQKTILKFNISGETPEYEGATYIDNGRYQFNRIQYIKALDKFILVVRDTSTGLRHIMTHNCNPDDPGEWNEILITSADLEHYSFQHLYEDDRNIHFYFIRNNGGQYWLWRLKYAIGSWTEEYLCKWDIFSHESAIGASFYREKKIMIWYTDSSYLYMFDTKALTFSGNICPASTRVSSPVNDNKQGTTGRMYFAAFKTIEDGTTIESICYISNDTWTQESVINDFNVFKNAWGYSRRKRIGMCKDIYGENIMLLVAWNPAIMFRMSSSFIPTVAGVYETHGKSLKSILQELANNFLAFVRIDANNVGYFKKRTAVNTGRITKLVKDYTKERISDGVYSEKYDVVEVSAGPTTRKYGDDSINANRLQVSLELIPEGYASDLAKYFYDYYQTLRYIYTLRYKPILLNVMDIVDLSDYGFNTGKVHSMAFKKTESEIQILADG